MTFNVGCDLNSFQEIGLHQMAEASLMDRREFKFALPLTKLGELLQSLLTDYRMLSIQGIALQAYRNVYFDTVDFAFFRAQQVRCERRHKVRLRQYLSTESSFLEIKRRERGATVKLRVPCNEDISTESEFLRGHGVDSQQLIPRVAVFYDRITLVRTLPTPERLTFDLNLRLVHVGSSQECRFSHSVITELKTPGGLHQSHFAACARRCGLRTAAISKYGVGVSLLHPQVLSNLMRPQLRRLQQIELQGAS